MSFSLHGSINLPWLFCQKKKECVFLNTSLKLVVLIVKETNHFPIYSRDWNNAPANMLVTSVLATLDSPLAPSCIRCSVREQGSTRSSDLRPVRRARGDCRHSCAKPSKPGWPLQVHSRNLWPRWPRRCRPARPGQKDHQQRRRHAKVPRPTGYFR